MSTQTSTSTDVDVRDLLNQSHARLDRLFEAVLDAFQEGDRVDAAALWSEFETCLRNHFDFEDVHLLPSFRKVYPHEAEEIARERMRQTLAELGTGVDLHLTRADVVKEFLAQLRAHAAREDVLLYRWAKAMDEKRRLVRGSKNMH